MFILQSIQQLSCISFLSTNCNFAHIILSTKSQQHIIFLSTELNCRFLFSVWIKWWIFTNWKYDIFSILNKLWLNTEKLNKALLIYHFCLNEVTAETCLTLSLCNWLWDLGDFKSVNLLLNFEWIITIIFCLFICLFVHINISCEEEAGWADSLFTYNIMFYCSVHSFLDIWGIGKV